MHGRRIGHNRRRCKGSDESPHAALFLTVFGGSALVIGLVVVAAVMIPGPPRGLRKGLAARSVSGGLPELHDLRSSQAEQRDVIPISNRREVSYLED